MPVVRRYLALLNWIVSSAQDVMNSYGNWRKYAKQTPQLPDTISDQISGTKVDALVEENRRPTENKPRFLSFPACAPNALTV